MVSDGIEVVAVVVEIAITRSLEQPDGGHLTWQWRRASADEQPPFVKWLVQSTESYGRL